MCIATKEGALQALEDLRDGLADAVAVFLRAVYRRLPYRRTVIRHRARRKAKSAKASKARCGRRGKEVCE